MRKREFPCYEGMAAAVDCVCRQTVLLQNLAQTGSRCPGWIGTALQQLRGLAAAAHREWRELNRRLGRIFVTPVDREDLSLLVRETAELADALACAAALWRTAPPESAPAWAARLAEGARLLQALTAELPKKQRDDAISAQAGALYAWRRDADRAWENETPSPAVNALYGCCRRLARIADTAEWVILKNG